MMSLPHNYILLKHVLCYKTIFALTKHFREHFFNNIQADPNLTSYPTSNNYVVKSVYYYFVN